jgi:hypothetical protein
MAATFQERKHTALLYDTEQQRDSEIIRFINEGLSSDQFCIYGSIHVRDKEHFQSLASRITDYEKNIKEGRLLVVDFAPFYIAALTNDLTPFKEVQRQIAAMFRNNKDMKVRLAGDATDLLFKNMHFDECALIEEWWQNNRIEAVTTLCVFEKSLFGKHPFNYHKHRIFTSHDVAMGSNGSSTEEADMQ